MRITAGIAALALAIGGGLLTIGWFAYAAIAWAGYGWLQVDRRPDPMLERFIPQYEVAERHEIRVRAPASVTYAAARGLDLEESRLVRAIFRGREILMRAPQEQPRPRESLVAQTLRLGWGVLAEEPGRGLVMGAVTQPWKGSVTFHRLAPEEFAAFDEPGYAKIVWTLSVEPTGDSESIFRTVTRVHTTDAESRRHFRRYWSIFSPGILAIRLESLRVVRREAERRYRSGG